MNIEKFAINNVIRIILNQNQQILHTNINWVEANSYLDKLVVLDNLADNISVQYCIANHHVVIDRFIFNSQPHYLIIIAIRNDCSSCTKVFKDEVTGLFNRNFLKHIAEDKIYYSKPACLSLILVDIDNLKEINDTYGHIAGDKVIRLVGQAIKKGIRQEDIGIRYGGDEFIISLPTKDKIVAEEVVTRIRKMINKMAKKHKIDIKVSVGIASSNNIFNIEEMIRMADKQLYKEKIIKSEQKEEDIKSNLTNEILNIKEELNKKVVENDNNLNNIEILELSQRLDDLIINYLE
ncbi:MAG TPA: GGDEF domain-containing protein [Thermoanaerobacterales bacterium]|nr:GGDEF domain-containing protein [Thermoanaerobacterales bacterium]